MNSIAFDVENEKRFSSRIQSSFKRYQISSILKKSNAYKEQGFSVIALIQWGCKKYMNMKHLEALEQDQAVG